MKPARALKAATTGNRAVFPALVDLVGAPVFPFLDALTS